MFELLILGLFIWLVYAFSKPGTKNTIKSGRLIDTNSREYIQGYLDGFSDCDKGIENTQITKNSAAIDNYKLNPVDEVIAKQNTLKSQEKNRLQNINIALYMASFLFVIAAALFMQQTFSDEVKFVVVWLVTILFYGAGLAVNRFYPKLRTAATAFLGTGLAMLPFTGFALNFFILHDPAMSWMITSFIGLAGYIYAAIHLNSRTISYLAIAFMVSLSTSSVATMKLALIWYFIALILLGSFLTFLSLAKPKLMPKCFSEPIEKTNSFIVPFSLFASLIAGSELALSDFAIITAACAIYYVAVALTSKIVNIRDYSLIASRVLVSVSCLVLCYDLTDSYVSTGIMLTTIGSIQVLISSFGMPVRKLGDVNNEVCLWLGLVAQFIAMSFIHSDSSWPLILLIQLMILAMSSFGASIHLKRSEISLFGSFAMLMAPLVWGQNYMSPVVANEYLSFFYLFYLAILLVGRYFIKQINKHPVLDKIVMANFAVYLTTMLVLPLSSGNIWIFAIWMFGAVMTYAYMTIQKYTPILLLGNLLFAVSLFALLSETSDDSGWVVSISSVTLTALFYLASTIMGHYGKLKYSEYFWLSSVVSGLLLGFIGLGNYIPKNQSVASFGVVLASMAMLYRGVRNQEYALTSWGLIAITFGLQKLVSVNITDLNFLIYTHWWAFIFAVLSYAYSMLGRARTAKIFTIIALSFITLFGGLQAISHMSSIDNSYSTLFFVEHAIILIFGLVASARLQRNWGTASIIVAMLWMMSGLTFLLPVIIAIILVFFAIRALSKISTDK